MPADIVEGADAALLVAHNDDAGIGNLTEEIVARVRDLICTPGAEPHVEVDGFHLPPKMISIRVILLRKRSCLRSSQFRSSICVNSGHDVPPRCPSFASFASIAVKGLCFAES